MRFVRMLACAGAAAIPALVANADFDSIGESPAWTDDGFWLNSATNTDSGGDVATCAGVGLIVVPAGGRVTEIQAVIGTRGPGGADSIDLAGVTRWHVEFWSDVASFAAAADAGNVASLTYGAPTNPGYASPYGTDSSGRPTYLVKFRLPGGINPSQTQSSIFAIRIDASQENVGTIGVLESVADGPSGLWASHTLGSAGYLPFSLLPFHAHDGVFAYRVVAGCGADYNGDGEVSVQDIFDFLSAWFAGEPGAAFGGSGAITVQDIFDFLSAWFAGCS